MLRNNIIDNNQLFVISDLHIGDSSKKDSFSKSEKDGLLDSFLDFVEKEDGSLLILGDLLELWLYKPDSVLSGRKDLLDRLNEMPVTFVAGNHDNLVLNLDKSSIHPFFNKTSAPFIKTIGGRRFKFMHGHEFDPFMTETIRKCGQKLGYRPPASMPDESSHILKSGWPYDLFLEFVELIFKILRSITKNTTAVMRKACALPYTPISLLIRALRDNKIIERHFYDKSSNLYDIVVAGHTHRPAILDNWYLNTGSWIGPASDFLVINPDGRSQILAWTPSGPKLNHRLITT